LTSSAAVPGSTKLKEKDILEELKREIVFIDELFSVILVCKPPCELLFSGHQQIRLQSVSQLVQKFDIFGSVVHIETKQNI